MRTRPEFDREFLRARRVLAKHTVTSLAHVCGITPGYLSNIEAGRRRPTPEVARTIAYHLGVPLDELPTFEVDAA